MGNSNSNNANDTINWNNIKTDNMSSTLRTKYLTNDVKQLVLNLDNYETSEVSDFKSNFLLNNEINQINQSNQSNQSGGALNITETDKSTSPFITSEMYNYIVDKYQNQNNMNGGAKKNKNTYMSDDDSSTSSTSSSKLSSSSSSSESDKPKKSKKHITGGRKAIRENKKHISEDNLSYVSSSAHTASEKSISDENSVSISSSVRTSQINLISDN